MTYLIDTHVHLDVFEDPAAMAGEAASQGVAGFVLPGTRIAGWSRLMRTVAACPHAVAAPGVHPMDAENWQTEQIDTLMALHDRPKAVAVGEVGLDRKLPVSWGCQERLFREMIQMARRLDKPLLIHNRRATGRLIDILREEHADQVGGIWHAFNGSLETARQVLDLGFVLGIGGIVTYPEARRLSEVVSQVPESGLVLETDAPDMAPHPHRRARNRPANLALIAAAVARLRHWSWEETARTTTANALRVLRCDQALFAADQG
ncbi:MAG: TatD family hydrolase [Deltaproteobacteria bacterium]|jgi:TatD DNase family protein|nr:TatD family hydrolase [Deltaproteobacteria bacterium]